MSDRLISRPALGVRAVDVQTRVMITEGLEGRAWPERRADQARAAIVGPSGALSWHELPGLVPWGHLDPLARPAARRWVVEIRDRNGRYQPTRAQIDLPSAGEPPWLVPGGAALPLYSAPARDVPEGFQAVRACLWDRARDRPAAWAVLSVVVGPVGSARAVGGLGLTGPDGQVLVLVPSPETPVSAALVSPDAQRWPVRASVLYSALDPQAPPMRSAIEAQRAGRLWLGPVGDAPFDGAELQLGRSVVLRSREDGRPASVLYVSSSD